MDTTQRITFTPGAAAPETHQSAESAARLYLQALRSLLRTFALIGRATFVGLRHLFRRHPNLTWLAITIALCAWLGLKVAQARSERDRYSAEAARLIERLDSINNNSQTPLTATATRP